jgi:hypothetical protein
MKNERRRLAGWIVSGECIMCVGRQLKAHLAKVVFFNTKRGSRGTPDSRGPYPEKERPHLVELRRQNSPKCKNVSHEYQTGTLLHAER